MIPAEGAIGWTSFLALRAADQARARLAAEALSNGDAGPALGLLEPWRFAGMAHAAPVLHALAAAPLSPDPGALAFQLGEADRVPRAPAQALWLHREWLARRPLPAPAPDDGRAPLTWALLELRGLGQDLEHRLRRPWRCRPALSRPEDAQVAGLWRRVGSAPWADRDAWERLFLPTVLSAFHAVFEAVNLPRPERRARLGDISESFFFRLVGHAPEAGWRVLASRVLETLGGGPFHALAAALDPPAWAMASRCAVRRGHGWRTAQLLWPEAPRARVLAERLGALLAEGPDQLEGLAELHAALRVVARWRAPEATLPGTSWRVLTQNLGRARGRLRSLVRRLPDGDLVGRLCASDALYERTTTALARLARTWAFDELRGGFANDEGRALEAGCDQARPTLLPLDPQLRAWILLVILRGRLEHLRRWLKEGSTGDRDAGWGRLLSMQPPPDTRLTGTRAEELDALRARLSLGLPSALVELRPTLDALAALPGERLDLGEVHRILAPIWHPDLPLPQAARLTLRAHAAQAAREIPLSQAVR